MVNKSKQKGTRWEKEFVELILENIYDSDARRVAGSGALGTSLGEPLLTGDAKIKLKGFNKPFRVECKTGYGGETQLTVKREWINKIIDEAKDSLAYPMLAFKFLGARKTDGVKYFVILDFDTFCDIMNSIAQKESIMEKLSNG
jgi:Holliday junction resolvase